VIHILSTPSSAKKLASLKISSLVIISSEGVRSIPSSGIQY
jgi:hypothetical protein